MTGPEHYREAERLLDAATSAPERVHAAKPHASGEVVLTMIGNLLAEAQVHATLALAAATSYQAERDYLGDESTSARAWTAVAS